MPTESITVLRLGLRFVRDDRTLTHLCLVSRALGAEAVFLQEVEPGLLRSIAQVNATWGGKFAVVPTSSWKQVIGDAKNEGRKVVHLTMYGSPLHEKVGELRKHKKLLLVVGGPKVPGQVYGLADHNISVTSQPHSEIAALAVVLHEVWRGEELKRDFGKSRLRIIPAERGKRIVRT